MWEPSPGVQDAIGTPQPAAREVLDATVLRSLYDINRSFLLQAERLLGEPAAPGRRLPVALGGLPPAQRLTVAGCPYTLFDLRFADAAFWRSIATDVTEPRPLDGPLGAFTRGAVFLAWHLARSRPLAAPLALGMAPAVLEVWRALPVSALDPAAASAAAYLSARWAEHPRFWPALADAAHGGNRRELADAQLFGLQLLAAEGLRVRAPLGAAISRR